RRGVRCCDPGPCGPGDHGRRGRSRGCDGRAGRRLRHAGYGGRLVQTPPKAVLRRRNPLRFHRHGPDVPPRLEPRPAAYGEIPMAKKPTARTDFVLVNVVYEDGSQKSNRKVPADAFEDPYDKDKAV